MTTFREILTDCANPKAFERYVEVIRRNGGHAIAGRIEQAKIDLSVADTVDVDLRDVVNDFTVRATKKQFERAIAGELERLTGAVHATLAASSRSAADITTVFLTGGTSAVPAVKHLLALLLPKARAIEGDLFNSVGFGLALEAKRRFAR